MQTLLSARPMKPRVLNYTYSRIINSVLHCTVLFCVGQVNGATLRARERVRVGRGGDKGESEKANEGGMQTKEGNIIMPIKGKEMSGRYFTQLSHQPNCWFIL